MSADWQANHRSLMLALRMAEEEIERLKSSRDELLAACEALKAGVEDVCELWRRCDVAACNCGKEHLTILGHRVKRARAAIANARKERP